MRELVKKRIKTKNNPKNQRDQSNATNHTSQITRTKEQRAAHTETGRQGIDERGWGWGGMGKPRDHQSVSLNGNPTKKERIYLEIKLKEMSMNERLQIETDLKGAPSSGKFYTEPLPLRYVLAKLISSRD